jgi:hypothetical protein
VQECGFALKVGNKGKFWVTRAYGLEGELLSVGGSTEPVTNTYDALYRLKTLKDGNNNVTTYATTPSVCCHQSRCPAPR